MYVSKMQNVIIIICKVFHKAHSFFVQVCPKYRDYVRGGSEGALAPPEFGGSEKRTERETDNLLLLAPPESKS